MNKQIFEVEGYEVRVGIVRSAAAGCVVENDIGCNGGKGEEFGKGRAEEPTRLTMKELGLSVHYPYPSLLYGLVVWMMDGWMLTCCWYG